MHPESEPVAAIAAAMQKHLGDAPPTALVLGSGLGGFVDRVRVRSRVDTRTLGLPQSTVAGHAGELITGNLGEADIAVLSGRVHLYEGYGPAKIVRYVRALKQWGVKRLLLTCSAGGMTEGMVPGTLVVITDHINLQGCSPLTGPQWGPVRFPAMGTAYDPDMRADLHAVAEAQGISLSDGVYVAMMGPAYETPAEIRMARIMGADLVGMSTVPEVLAAVEAGLTVAALSVVSNLAAGMGGEPLNHEEVSETADRVAEQVADLFEGVVQRWT